MAEPTRTPLALRERGAEPEATGRSSRPRRSSAHLPGVEPERRLNDWGRSERVEGFFDRTLVEFFYRYWFRAEVEGIENVPAAGGALLVSNHSGALPPDAAMIGKAIREEHPHPRPLNITVEHFFKGYPGLLDAGPEDRLRRRPTPPTCTGCSTTRSSSCSSSPRAARAPRSSTRTATSCAASAAAASSRRPCARACRSCRSAWSAPRRRRRCSPSSACCKRLTGLPYFPITPTFPHFGLLGMLGYLPAKFKIRFLEPIHFDDEGMHEDKALVQTVAHDDPRAIQENL